MKMKKVFAMLIAASMAFSMLTACGGKTDNVPADTNPGAASTSTPSVSEEPVSGGTVTYALASGWDTIKPGYWVSAGFYNTVICTQLYDKLVDVTDDGYVARGAKSWSINEDKTVMTFNLEENAKFSDGTPVTAHDWEFSAKLLSTEDFGAPDYTKFNVMIAGTDETGLLAEGEEFGVVALDDYTLQITFKEPMSFDNFFNNYVYYYYVLPEHCFEGMSAAEMADADFWQNPVCSGPWTMVSEVVNSTLTLAPNPNYHGGVSKLDSLIYQVMDASNFASALMSGSIDYCYPSISADEATALSQMNGIVVENSSTANEFWFFCINNQKVNEVDIRKAINMAIDKELIAEQLFAGSAVAVESVELYGSKLYNNDLTSVYDPEAAADLLAASGWDFDRVLNIATPSGVRAQIATIIADNLSAIGMKTEVNTVDIGSMYAGMHGGQFDAIMGGGTPNLNPLYFQSNLEYTAQSSSIIKTDDATYHELAGKITSAATEEEASKYIMEYQQYMFDNAVVVPVVAVYMHTAHTERLNGIDTNLSRNYSDNTWEWYIAE